MSWKRVRPKKKANRDDISNAIDTTLRRSLKDLTKVKMKSVREVVSTEIINTKHLSPHCLF